MKKYYMSFIDFSEVANVTADYEQIEKAKQRMIDLGLLTEKGNPSPAHISAIASSISSPFFDKLQRRIARRNGGIIAVRDTLRMLNDRKEYTAVFLYLAFLYGFLEWQVPEQLTLLPAVPDVMKCFASEFIADFDRYLRDNVPESGANVKDAEQTDM